ncbi:FecR protein [Paraburkholderia sp. Tr-20389]|uniref:DUF6600 domain-containing protein n=1 Tax=Paraburkholderia sp. Tr-20389 TaxID=2703903 RepID=UPI00197F8AB0|nr:DUF6600 domain-containing protein [Paraburkholderia sp. Tr-20389]MBN3757488.1 FecR protein [Paraburkholderia sp. Tr-20389]
MKSLTTAYAHPAARRDACRTSLVALAVAGTLTAFALQPAWAQEAPPPANYAQGTPDGDPPGRVARLNYMAGTVTTEPAGASDWSYAQVNRPLTTGDQLWNDRNARSELHIGSTAVRMGQQTSLDILNLDDNSAQLKVAQGTLSTRVRAIAPGSTYEIDTPNLALGVNAPGDYRVDVAPDGSSTTVSVRSGSATVYGDNGQVPVGAGQQVTFTGTSLQQAAANGAPGPDAFDQWAANRDAAEDRSVSARYVSREMPGYQDLDANGTWRSTPQYGQVWVPNQEPEGWAPYHDGHWVWQAPWGWTWVDDAPWGFAPYHYGRWAYVDDSWAWVPGQEVVSAPPVYAPALVAFVGDGGGGSDWNVNLAVGGVAAAGLAWFALGPGEPWHPHWGRDHDWSPRYYERVNNTVIVNNRVDIHNNIHNTYINYRAPGAVTAMPAAAFVHGQPTSHFAHRVDPAQWHNARFNAGAPGIAPVQQSFGPGMRNAAYRPPANVMARPVVGTRNPGVPAAFHDRLAQNFAQGGHGRVPGAGEPIVHTSVPARFPGQTLGGNGPVANVRVVNSHAPGQMAGGPGAQRPGAPAPQMDGRQQGVPGRGFVPGQTAGGPGGQRPGAGEPQGNGQQQHGMPMQAGNGVPRPPQFAAGGHPMNGAQQQPGQAAAAQHPEMAAGQQHEPAWTQQHAPMAQQRNPQQFGAAQAPGQRPSAAQPGQLAQQQHEPMQQRPANAFGGGAAQAQSPHGPDLRGQQAAAPAQQPQAQPHAEMRPQPQASQQQARQEFRPQPQPQAQPRQEFHPQPQQPQQQARQEFHPQPQPQPRPEARPQPQQQARQEFHPQPQPQAQPRPESHPPQQAQQPHPQPQAQPQPHQEQRATGGGHDEHHRG